MCYINPDYIIYDTGRIIPVKKSGKRKKYLLLSFAAVIIAVMAYAAFILFFRIPQLMSRENYAENSYSTGDWPWLKVVTGKQGENIQKITRLAPDNILMPDNMTPAEISFSGNPEPQEYTGLFKSIPAMPPYRLNINFTGNGAISFAHDIWTVKWNHGKLKYSVNAEVNANTVFEDGINSILNLFPFPEPEGGINIICQAEQNNTAGNATFAGSFGDRKGTFFTSGDTGVKFDRNRCTFDAIAYRSKDGAVTVNFAPAVFELNNQPEYSFSGNITSIQLNTGIACVSINTAQEFTAKWTPGLPPEINTAMLSLKDNLLSGSSDEAKITAPAGGITLKTATFTPDKISAAELYGNFGGISVEAGKSEITVNKSDALTIASGNITIAHGAFKCNGTNATLKLSAQDGKNAIQMQGAAINTAINGITPFQAADAQFHYNSATQSAGVTAGKVKLGDDIELDGFKAQFTTGAEKIDAQAGALSVNPAKFNAATKADARFSASKNITVSLRRNLPPEISAANVELKGRGVHASFKQAVFSLKDNLAAWQLGNGTLITTAPLPDIELRNLNLTGGNDRDISSIAADSVIFNGYNLGRITGFDRQKKLISIKTEDGSATEYSFSNDVFIPAKIKIFMPEQKGRKLPFGNMTLAGTMEIEGIFNNGKPVITAKFKGDIAMPGIVIKSAATTAELKTFKLDSSSPFQQLSAKSINFHGIPLENISASYTLNQGRIKLQLLNARLWNGSVTLTPSPEPDNRTLNFMTYGIDGSSLARFLGFDDAEINGSFEGMIAFEQDNFPQFAPSSLVTTPGRTGKVKISQFPEVDADELSMQITRAALAGFNYNFIRFDFNGDRVRFTADGSPETPVPFVADPVTGAFRPATDTEPGFNRELTVEMEFKPRWEK